jgi:hypothetical protein
LWEGKRGRAHHHFNDNELSNFRQSPRGAAVFDWVCKTFSDPFFIKTEDYLKNDLILLYLHPPQSSIYKLTHFSFTPALDVISTMKTQLLTMKGKQRLNKTHIQDAIRQGDSLL